MAHTWTPEILVTEQTAREALRRSPGLPTPLAMAPLRIIGEGWDNLVFRLGDGHALRMPRRAIAAELMAGELDFLAAWASPLARRSGLPVPEVVARLPAGDGYPFECAVVTWLDGETGCSLAAMSGDAVRAACAPALGRFLRALHGLPATLPGGRAPRGDTFRRAEVPHRIGLIRGWLAELAAEAPDLDLRPAAPVLEALAETPLWQGPPCWVHGDLYGRHLLLRDGGLSGVIDWGDVHLGDPALDVSIARSWLPRSAWSAFFEAYGPIDEATWARARLRTLNYVAGLWRYAKATGDEGMGRLAAHAWAAALDDREAGWSRK